MSNEHNFWFTYLPPNQCMPPHGLTHPDKLEELISQFAESGFDKSKPKLLGYYWPEENKIQLISGSHRWLAARYTNTDLPVKIYPFEYIEKIWGTDEWLNLLSADSSVVQ